MRRRIRAVSVVVPARDEEALLPAALDALLEARAVLSRTPRLSIESCTIVVVLDRCTDESVQLAAGYAPAVRSLAIDAGAVGAARSAGVEVALAESGVPDAAHWICTTDADSVVPPSWLVDHLAAADQGADVALGRVAPFGGGLAPEALAAWAADYARSDEHVHGANLGIRADVYRELGGFAPLAEHEDVSLLSLARASGRRVHALDSVVLTSGRLDGRTPGGFSGFLRDHCAVPDPS